MTEATHRRRIHSTTPPVSTESNEASSTPTIAPTVRRKRRRRDMESPVLILGLTLAVVAFLVYFGGRWSTGQKGTKPILQSPSAVSTKDTLKPKAAQLESSASGPDKPAAKSTSTTRTNNQHHDTVSSSSSSSSGITQFSGHIFRRAPSDAKVLAMIYPPGLMGGYRNQVIRLLAFCVHALQHKMDSLLIPSIMWATQIEFDGSGKEEWTPIPMDLLFDIDHWNTFKGQLPTLVDNDGTYPCWGGAKPKPEASKLTDQVLARGFFQPIVNRSRAIATREEITNLRWLDLVGEVEHCERPHVYGGGTGAGRLWNDYIKLQSRDGIPYNADSLVLRALRPKQEWRDLAMSCVAKKAHNTKAYVALHARVELEMMGHKCGKRMERNLTKLFDEVEELIGHDLKEEQIGGVFVAVSRSGIEITEGSLYEKFKAHADENLATLNKVAGGSDGSTGVGMAAGSIAVFECGKRLMDEYYAENPDSIDYGGLLQSIVNFHIAVESTAFVGTRGSSYSTDVWTTRYHLGRGGRNYEYTKQGIKLMGNGGLPPPHKNC